MAAGAGRRPGRVYGVSSGPDRRPVSAGKMGVAATLVVLGVLLWIMTGVTAYGLISGLGVVIAYAAAEPWLERWRNS